MLIAGISVLLALEQGSLGMSTGHAETITYVEEFLRRLEGERSTDAEHVPPDCTGDVRVLDVLDQPSANFGRIG